MVGGLYLRLLGGKKNEPLALLKFSFFSYLPADEDKVRRPSLRGFLLQIMAPTLRLFRCFTTPHNLLQPAFHSFFALRTADPRPIVRPPPSYRSPYSCYPSSPSVRCHALSHTRHRCPSFLGRCYSIDFVNSITAVSLELRFRSVTAAPVQKGHLLEKRRERRGRSESLLAFLCQRTTARIRSLYAIPDQPSKRYHSDNGTVPTSGW